MECAREPASTTANSASQRITGISRRRAVTICQLGAGIADVTKRRSASSEQVATHLKGSAMKWLSIVALAGLLALSIVAGLSFAAEPCAEQVS
jgi:hypothetical protein